MKKTKREWVWVVHYQIPLKSERANSIHTRQYQEMSVAFKDKMQAVEFFRSSIEPQEWFDESVCYVEGPVELR